MPAAALRRPAVAVAVLIAVALAGCGKSAPPGGAPGPGGAAPPPPEVVAVTVAPRDVPVEFEYVGQTAGVREVEVRPRVGGILLKWNYTEGARVKAGQSLFTIDPAPFQAAVNRLDATLSSAMARRAQAAREAARLEPLVKEGMVTRKAYDDAVAAETIAAADEKTARAALAEARLQLSYTNVTAPISGVTGLAVRSEGSLVEAQQTLLTSISQIEPIHVLFSIPEAEHMQLQRESAEGRLRLPEDGRFEAKVVLSDGKVFEQAGKVDFTNVRVNPGTGSIEARAVMPNPDLKLRPGMFARVKLTGAMRPEALTVPQRAVLEGPGTKIVLTVNDKGLVEPRPVQVGDWTGTDWIIAGGLKPGDKVIVDGIVKVRPGGPVKIAQAPPEGGAPPNTPPPAAKP